MAFVNLSLLFGAMLTAIPIVLHLAMRRQPKHIVFPAVRFVKQRSEANRRRLQLRQWLLLLLRCLAIAALAAALARPSVNSAQLGDWVTIGLVAALLAFVLLLGAVAVQTRKGRLLVGLLGAAALVLLVAMLFLLARALGSDYSAPGGGQQAPVSAVLVFDTSPRMQYRTRNQTRLEQAQDIAQWLIRQLPPDSEVAVVDSRLRRPVFAVDLAAASKAIEQARTTGTPQPLARVLQDALELATGPSAQNEVRELYVFTDMTEAAWSGGPVDALAGSLEKARQVLLYVIDVGAENPQNFALGELQLSGEVLAKNSDLRVDTEVMAVGEGGQRVVELSLENPDPRRPMIRDGQTLLPELQPRGRQTCDIPPNGSQKLQFLVRNLPPGVLQGQTRLVGEDGLAFDDVRYFTVEVRDPWRVLAAAPPGVAVKLLTDALAPYEFRQTGQARFKCDVIDQAQLGEQRLSDYAAVCLVDPLPLEPAAWQKLAEYVRGGGGVAVFLGHNGYPGQSMNEPDAQALIAGRLARQWRAGVDGLYLAPQRLDHPILRILRPLATSVPWRQYPVFKHWVVDPLASDSHVIIPFSNGKAALAERMVGKGRVLTMTTPVSEPARPEGRDPWNELVAGEDPWVSFVLMNEMMLYLAGSGDERLNYKTGDVAVLPNEAERDPERYQLFTPLEDPQDLTARRGQITVRFTEQPGAYRLKGHRGGPVVRGFSVNLPLEASHLTRTTRKSIEDVLGRDRFQLARSRDDIVFGVRRARVGREFYSFLLAVLVLTLGLEHLLANLFYPKHETAAVK